MEQTYRAKPVHKPALNGPAHLLQVSQRFERHRGCSVKARAGPTLDGLDGGRRLRCFLARGCLLVVTRHGLQWGAMAGGLQLLNGSVCGTVR